MNHVSDSPNHIMDLESEISKQLDKIRETGNIFRNQILELGKTLKSFQDTEGQIDHKLQDQSNNTIPGWMKSVEIKLKEMTDIQKKISEEVQDLEKRRLNLQKVMAGKLEDVLKDVATLKSWTKTTMELKPKLDQEKRTIQDLESQVQKAKGELKEKLDLLDSAVKSNQNSVKSSVEKFNVPTREEFIDADGWIVIQRRDSGPRDDFERGWTEYENGFGPVDGNFWIGLKKIHELTANGSKELRIELTDWEGNSVHANYSQFSVGNAADLYRLSVGGYSGDAADGLKYHNRSQFSTNDKKNGEYAEGLKGGWWKKSYLTNLNGLYYEGEEAKADGIREFRGMYWQTWKCSDYSLQKVLMKIRRRK